MPGVDASAISRTVGVKIEAGTFNAGKVSFLPQQVALLGQGNTQSNSSYSLDPYTITSALQAAKVYGYGSPIHLAARQLFPRNNDGIKSIPVTVYPLHDNTSAGIAAGSIQATGTATETSSGFLVIAGIRSEGIQIKKDHTANDIIVNIQKAISSILEMPIIAENVINDTFALRAKWGGESGNEIAIDASNLLIPGVVLTITQMTGGTTNPVVTAQLEKFGTKWETIILNLLNYTDNFTLDALEEFGRGRWSELVKKGVFAITGSTDSFETSVVETKDRKDDFINVIIPAPGSPELPFVVAARAVSRIAVTANNNPPRNYIGKLNGIIPGPDGEQFLYSSLNNTLKAGCSTTILQAGVIKLNDVITCYHPDGEAVPSYRYVVDLVKLQNIAYNVNLIFENDTWKGVPLVPTNQPSVNPEAKSPKDAKTVLNNLADSLAINAFISDAEFTKENTTVVIDSNNPRRLDIKFPVKLSGSIEIIDAIILFGFYFDN